MSMQSPDWLTHSCPRCHALIKDGAKLIENFQDVIDDLTPPLDQTTATENAATDKASRQRPKYACKD